MKFSSPAYGKLISVGVLILVGAWLGMNQATQGTSSKTFFDSSNSSMQKATFAGGCFWCLEAPFEKMDGVREVVSGYMGGEVENPTYEEVSSGRTDYREVVQVRYNPDTVSYKDLLEVYWRQINPTDDGGQFVDRDFQYTTAIFITTKIKKSSPSYRNGI